MPLDIQRIPISDITPASYNPRKDLQPSDPEFEKLRKSIETFGCVEPLIWNRKTGNLVGGHQRLKILIDRGDTEVEVSVVNLDESREKALNIALNKISGEWDHAQLAEVMATLDGAEFDMSLTGFDLVETTALLDSLTEANPDADIPEIPKNPKTQLGDIVQLGPHRVLCGDATDSKCWEALMAGKLGDIISTDPPYNVAYGSSKIPNHKMREILNDNMGAKEWEAFNRVWASNALKYYSGGDIYVWGAPGPTGMAQRQLLVDMGIHWSATIIWKKQHFVLSRANYQKMYEPCFYGWKNKSSFIADRKQVEVWEVDRPTRSGEHPTMKPIELCKIGIRNSSQRGDIVLDPFLGSGSTLLACQELDRVCYGMELDPGYCDVIKVRYENYIGKG